MKKLFLIITLAFMAVSQIVAQTMTDDQIIRFVQKEQMSGTTQAQIVTKLMEKGVSVQKIQQMRKKYASQTNPGPAAEADQDGLRQNNGKYYRTYQNEAEVMPESRTPRQNTESLYHGHKVFGRDIFNNDDLTFEPAMNLATPQNYVLGPGDQLKVDVYGASQKSSIYTVSPDGDITIEGYGPINVIGLSVEQANAKLRSTLGSRFTSSAIKSGLAQSRTISVNVMGEVRTPGTFTLSAFATVFHALYQAGGISEIGTLRNIKVYRDEQLITTVDVYDYLLNGHLAGNVRLADNDVIVVGPYETMVEIQGKVKRPMYYELKGSENLTTLMRYCGGFAGDAYTKAVRITRKNGSRYSVFNVKESDMSSFGMTDGDYVSVDSILARYENMVEVRGAVFRPGMYRLGQQVSTVRDLIRSADGVMEDAITTRGIIHRLKEDRTLKVISVDVQGIMDGRLPDVMLQNEDVLFIPSMADDVKNSTIAIHGEVHHPGTYRYADNETLEDAVLHAGGLKISASTVKVEVSRRINDAKALVADSIVAETYEFTLKDGFVIDGEPGFTLMPYDEIYVHRSPVYSEQRNVVVTGEINFPGVYALPKRETRLSDLFKMAGGGTMSACIEGASLTRRLTADERQMAEDLIEIMSRQQAQEANADSLEMTKRIEISDTYSVGIELDKALKNPGTEADILLREGDVLHIPLYGGTVQVNGEVMKPNTVAYSKGKGIKYYLAAAGGVSNYGKKSRTYIIYQNGNIAKLSQNAKPAPGCTIVVPRKKKSNIQNTTTFVSLGATLASVAAVLVTALK